MLLILLILWLLGFGAAISAFVSAHLLLFILLLIFFA